MLRRILHGGKLVIPFQYLVRDYLDVFWRDRLELRREDCFDRLGEFEGGKLGVVRIVLKRAGQAND